MDVLSDPVFEKAAEWSEGLEQPMRSADAMRVAGRLSRVLRSIASVAVGTYREEELRQDREIAVG